MRTPARSLCSSSLARQTSFGGAPGRSSCDLWTISTSTRSSDCAASAEDGRCRKGVLGVARRERLTNRLAPKLLAVDADNHVAHLKRRLRGDSHDRIVLVDQHAEATLCTSFNHHVQAPSDRCTAEKRSADR